jgi:hypothetical protein
MKKLACYKLFAKLLAQYTSICDLKQLYRPDRSPLSYFIYIVCVCVCVCVCVVERSQRILMVLYMIEYQTLYPFPCSWCADSTFLHNSRNLSQNYYYHSSTFLSVFRQYLTKPSPAESYSTAILSPT